jgi:threonine synthase
VKNKEIEPQETVKVVVPTGNFGNILSAYYAKQMGVPIDKLICASNKNNVLTDFINTGVYDANRDFYKTTSPSMDILISSNVERLLFELCSRDGQQVGALMQALSQQRKYTLPAQAAQALKAQFVGAWAADETAAAEIQRVYREHGVVQDPHIVQIVVEFIRAIALKAATKRRRWSSARPARTNFPAASFARLTARRGWTSSAAPTVWKRSAGCPCPRRCAPCAPCPCAIKPFATASRWKQRGAFLTK